MLSRTSQDFRKIFLLQFTKELIKNSSQTPIYELETTLDYEEKENLQKTQNEKKKIHYLIKEKETFSKKFKPLPQPLIRKRPLPRILTIPRAKLPPNLQYLRPFPTNIQIDLEKINPLLKDPSVRTIECNGPNEKIFVSGKMGRKPTNIILNKEEIEDIIKKFSDKTKIPVQEGIFNVAVGQVELSAIISDIVGSKFIIGKMRRGG